MDNYGWVKCYFQHSLWGNPRHPRTFEAPTVEFSNNNGIWKKHEETVDVPWASMGYHCQISTTWRSEWWNPFSMGPLLYCRSDVALMIIYWQKWGLDNLKKWEHERINHEMCVETIFKIVRCCAILQSSPSGAFLSKNQSNSHIHGWQLSETGNHGTGIDAGYIPTVLPSLSVVYICIYSHVLRWLYLVPAVWKWELYPKIVMFLSGEWWKIMRKWWIYIYIHYLGLP